MSTNSIMPVSALPTTRSKSIGSKNSVPNINGPSDISETSNISKVPNKPRIPTKDSVYENKRKAYEQTMGILSKDIEVLKTKSAELTEKMKATLSGEEGKAERESLLESLQKLRKKRDQMNEEKTSLVKRLDESLEIARFKGAELDSAREKLPCKRREELDGKILELEKTIESGVSLSEEKRIVAEISKLHKSRRSFDSLSSLFSGKEQIDSQVESIRSSIKKLDLELKSTKILIKEQNDKYSEILSKKTNSTSLIQTIRKSLEEIRVQIDEKFKERTRAYEAFTAAKEAHNLWSVERVAKYQALQAKRQIEDEMKSLEKELHSLSVVITPPEIQSLETLENLIINQIPNKNNASNSAITLQSLAPRVVERIDSKKFTVVEKVEDSYFEGNKKSSIHSKNNAKSHSISIPPWVSLDLEVYGIGTVRSVEDAENAVKRITALKEERRQLSAATDKDKETRRSELKAQIEAVKERLANLEIPPPSAIKEIVS